jgi:hypothetical protein
MHYRLGRFWVEILQLELDLIVESEVIVFLVVSDDLVGEIVAIL